MTEPSTRSHDSNPVQLLIEVEAIKQLKAKYCRLLDAKEWNAWRTLFTDDFSSDTVASGGKLVEGADAFISYVRSNLESARRVTVHQVHAPEIQLSSASTARGIWALEDLIQFAPGFSLHGFGHYHEMYENSAGVWRIKASKLTRIREDIVTPIGKFKISRKKH